MFADLPQTYFKILKVNLAGVWRGRGEGDIRLVGPGGSNVARRTMVGLTNRSIKLFHYIRILY